MMSEKRKKAHIFMFKSWQKSMSLRYYIDAFFILVISVCLQLYVIDFSETATSYYDILAEFNTKRDRANDTTLSAADQATAKQEFAVIENQYLDINDRACDQLVILYYVWIILTAYWFRNLFQIIYAKLRKKSYGVIMGEFFLSTLHLFLAGLAVFRYFAFHIHVDPEDPRYYKHYVINAAYEESFLNMTEITGLYMGIQWCRVIFLFKVNPTLGPMLNILYRMLQAISKFLIIYGLFLLIYVSGGRLFYTNQEPFGSDTDAIVTLFSASLGSFSFDMWNDQVNLSERYNYAYLISYLIISNVILLNFIIAILTTIYDEVKNLSGFIYLVEIVKTRSVFGHNEYYSSLISSFIPLNIFLLPTYPFLICCKSRKLNKILSHICYFPVAIIGTCLFFLITLLLVPFAYLALVYQNIVLVFQRGIPKWERCAYFNWL